MYKSNFFILLGILFLAIPSFAKVIPGLIDRSGNAVHTADEFNLSITTTVAPKPQGYQYTYNLSLGINSIQPIWQFMIFLPDVASLIPNSSSSFWGKGWGPKVGSSKENTSIRWGTIPEKNNQNLLTPTGTHTFTFTSPYPPGIAEAYAEGVTAGPWVPTDMASGNPLGFSNHTPYGPGKVFPVIGPVKPATPNVTDNYSVVGCAGGICDVQLDITGPQDPYGTTYTYTWTGAFGTATGAKPLVQLAVGNYNISVAVSDPYATLVTATMPITVIDPNPPVITPPAGGGNAGAGGAGQGSNTGSSNSDIDHDGIPDDEDDDRDGDGKKNSEDQDPDHPD
ncbi:hypothetical protein [Ghiorsea bivora]|uniref:hypothetical protein n=1 Tax=Ghiorsea bivora TaxID=1485545 RepID=UPI00056E58B6|nr:hypothetical protein [Ghiorsea bivora]